MARQCSVGSGERDVLLTKSSHFTLQPYDQSGEVGQLLGDVDWNILSRGVGWNVLLISSSLRVDNNEGLVGLKSPESTNLMVDTLADQVQICQFLVVN